MTIDVKPIVILHGRPRVGKDTAADALAVLGYRKFKLGKRLYAEVGEAFGLSPTVMEDDTIKDVPSSMFALRNCTNKEYVNRCIDLGHIHMHERRTMRWHLRHWGTEFRRQQDPGYWGHHLRAEVAISPDPVVICDLRADDYWVAEAIARDRQERLVTIEIIRPGIPIPDFIHASDARWPGEVIHKTFVSAEGKAGDTALAILNYVKERT